LVRALEGVGLAALGLVLPAIAAFSFLAWRFLSAVERRPESVYDEEKVAPDTESLCASCAYRPAFPDCPGEGAGDSFSAAEGPLYCDGYDHARTKSDTPNKRIEPTA
jgi:hypothetical protein